jgi:hypothetical protein
MVKSIDFSLFVIDRNWEVESIKFPYEEIAIYNIDKVSDLLKKIQLILNVHPYQIHIRGLTIDFKEWLKKNKDNYYEIKKKENLSLQNQDIKTNEQLEENSELNDQNVINNLSSITESTKKNEVFNLYFDLETNDNVYPKLLYKNNIVNTSLPIHAFEQPSITLISEVPCDNQYILFKKIVVDNKDIFLSEFSPINQCVIFLLDDYIQKKTNNALNILRDKFIFERVYDGFIKKYFPSMNSLDFQKFLSDNLPVYDEKLEINITHENKIFNNLIKVMSKKNEELKIKKFISSTTLLVPKSETQANINLRNILDKVHISPLYNENDLQIFMMYLEMPTDKSNKKYIINKYRSNTQNFKITSKYKNGLTFIRSIKKFLEYINITEDGNWTMTTSWKDEDEMEINQIIDNNIKSINPIIKYINTLTPFFAKEPLSLMNKNNIQISNITVCILWNKILNYLEFRLLRQIFNEFVMAGMAENRTSPILEVVWNKGVIENCIIKIYHRVTDIKIEIIDTNPKDYKHILDILLLFLYNVNNQINNMPKTKESSLDQKFIKKLREQDSQLYDKLKEGNIYSKKCQGIRQPIIYTDEEYNKLKFADKNNLYKFWNFTKNKPVYYSCQNDPSTKKPLIISFLTGIHEDDYCVPCCKKKELNEMSKHHERDQTCLNKYSFNKKSEQSASGYIFVSNKSINIGRLGFLPSSIIDILETKEDLTFSEQDIQQLKSSINNIKRRINDKKEDIIEQNFDEENDEEENDEEENDEEENEDELWNNIDIEKDLVNINNTFEVDEDDNLEDNYEDIIYEDNLDNEFNINYDKINNDPNISKINVQDKIDYEFNNEDEDEDFLNSDFTIGNRKFGGKINKNNRTKINNVNLSKKTNGGLNDKLLNDKNSKCVDIEDVSLLSIIGGIKKNTTNTRIKELKNNINKKKLKYYSTNNKKISGGYKIKDKPKNILSLAGRVSNTYLDDNKVHFYAYGVSQLFNAVDNAGIVYAITHALDISIADFIGKIVNYIKSNESSIFSPILCDALINIFVNNIDFYDWEADWSSLFADLVLEVFDINLVIFRPNKDSIRIRYNMSPKILIIQYEFEKKVEFYPIYLIDSLIFNKFGEIKTKIFQHIKEIDRLIPVSLTNDLTFVQKINEIIIKKQLINLNNKCYAVLASLKGSDELSYIPVLYSPLVSRIPIEYKVFKRKENILSLDNTIKILDFLHGKTTHTLWFYDIKKYKKEYDISIVGNHDNIPDDIKDNIIFIGFIHDMLNVYCNDKSYKEISDKYPELLKYNKYITDLDYDDVNDAIVNHNKISSSISDLYSDGYYYQNLYKLIKLELINLIDSGHIHIDTVKQMNVDKLVQLIPHVIDDNAKTDSNILIACLKGNLIHCENEKLKVPSNFRDYCEILYHELHNPVVNFMDNPRSLVVSMLNFEEVPGEKVIIKIVDINQ